MNQQNPTHWLQDPHGWFHRIFIREAILSSLLVLCFIGVAYTNFASSQSYNYWLWMIPVFAVAAIVSEWSRYRRHEIDGFHFLRQQLLHWGATFIAIKTIFLLHDIGRLDNDATALTLMATLSLSTFLAGVYIGWRFLVLGLFMTLATWLVAWLEAWIWVLIPVGIALVALGIAVSVHEFRKLAKHG